MEEFPHSYQEAQQALRIQKAVGGRERLTLFDDLGRVPGTRGRERLSVA